MFRLIRVPVTAAAVIGLVACSLATPTPAPPPTADAGATASQAAEWQAATADAAVAAATQTAAAEAAQATAAVAAGTATQAAASTATAGAAEATAVVAARTRTARQTATAAAKVAAATEAAAPLARQVQKLVDDGYLASPQGTYRPLEDFSESWAQLNWYRYWVTGLTIANFVLQADVHWKSASRTADWWNSGCGFVFREDVVSGDHYLVYLGLDGYVNLEVSRNNDLTAVADKYYAKVDVPEGQAKIVLVADQERLKVFVNDTLVVKAIDKRLTTGRLAYTLISGTNKDYGTRCDLTNVGVWELPD